ncbi:MAG: hypothetical protein ABSE55_17955, partial [Terracidiphilus sp.]
MWEELKATANFEHGENVRNRHAFGKPLASRKRIGESAPCCAIVRVHCNANAGRRGGAFVAGLRLLAQDIQHGFTSAISLLPAWKTYS